MERRCALRQRVRSSFEKVHGGEAPPRLQVIGFNVCAPPPKAAEAEAKHLELASGAPRNEASDLFLSPPAAPPAKPASSPRSALQQLLLTQSLPCASPPSPLYSLPHANQSLIIRANCCKSVDQSQIVSPPSPRNRSAGGARADEYSAPKPSRASIKQKYAAFHDGTGYTDRKTCLERPDPKGTGKESSSLHLDGEVASADSSQNGVLQVSQSSLRNEKSRKSSWTDQEGTRRKKNSLFMFVVSSPVSEAHRHHHHGEYDVCKDAYFLSSCHLCRRHLGHGKDVFMYSGDKAFCSMECRYQQIAIDERKERRPPHIIRSGAAQVHQHTYRSSSSPPTAAISRPNFINTAAAA